MWFIWVVAWFSIEPLEPQTVTLGTVTGHFQTRHEALARLVGVLHIDAMCDWLPPVLGRRDLWVDRRVSCAGEMMQSRVAAGLIEAVGLPELIVDSLKEYEELVVALSTTGPTGDRPTEASRARP